MLESPAWRALSLSGRRVIDRIEIELAHHGGNDNGSLPVTFDDFIAYGIHHNCIAPAIREAEALGFIKVTERGRGGNAEYRLPNKFFLTFAYSRTKGAEPRRRIGFPLGDLSAEECPWPSLKANVAGQDFRQ